MINRARKGAVRTQIKKYLEMTRQSKDVDALKEELQVTQRQIDQLAAKGIIHKNAASRKKSSLARQFNALTDKS
jgi:small subunit ribosomal protein S20